MITLAITPSAVTRLGVELRRGGKRSHDISLVFEAQKEGGGGGKGSNRIKEGKNRVITGRRRVKEREKTVESVTCANAQAKATLKRKK